MDRGTRVFWGLVLSLFCAAGWFGVKAEKRRREVHATAVNIQTGDLLSFGSVVDGDTVILKDAAGQPITVRVLGVKAFEAGTAKDVTTTYGKGAMDALQRELEGKPVRVMLGNPPKDKHGRAIATLFVDDEDVGLKLVREGWVMVYTAFPFPSMSEYLHAQELARADRKGLWHDPVAVERARALAAEWRKGNP